jgi:hypothetical protein
MGTFVAASIMVVIETFVGFISRDRMDCWNSPSGCHLHSGLCFHSTIFQLPLKNVYDIFKPLKS